MGRRVSVGAVAACGRIRFWFALDLPIPIRPNSSKGLGAFRRLGVPRKLMMRSKRRSVDTILIEIRDYGVGLKEVDRPFEAFYTTKRMEWVWAWRFAARSLMRITATCGWRPLTDPARHFILRFLSNLTPCLHRRLRNLSIFGNGGLLAHGRHRKHAV
jgi:hypothetical protein